MQFFDDLNIVRSVVFSNNTFHTFCDILLQNTHKSTEDDIYTKFIYNYNIGKLWSPHRLKSQKNQKKIFDEIGKFSVTIFGYYLDKKRCVTFSQIQL